MLDNFRSGIKTTRFLNAPAGLTYPGDPGYPEGNSGLSKQWWNFSPRAGVAWDVTGDGRTAVRSSYGMAYDFPSAQYLYIATSASPFTIVSVERGAIRGSVSQRPRGDTHPLSPTRRSTLSPRFGLRRDGPGYHSDARPALELSARTQIGSAWGARLLSGSYADRCGARCT